MLLKPNNYACKSSKLKMQKLDGLLNSLKGNHNVRRILKKLELKRHVMWLLLIVKEELMCISFGNIIRVFD